MIRVLILFVMGLVAIGMIVSDKDGGLALLTTAVVAGVGLILFRHYTDEKDFVTYVFLAALCTRLIAGMLIHTFDIRAFAGPDAYAYDYIGGKISDYWQGLTQMDPELQAGMSLRGSGWGMNYLMGVIYFLFGKSIFIAQSFCATVGAATAPLVYFCSQALFNNKRVSKFASIGVACFPAFIIWSSQLLKDGLIVFLLVLAMTLVIQLQRSISWLTILFLILSLFSILSLRFYIFYMVAAAVVGSFFVNSSTSFKKIVQRTAILVVIGLALTYLGVLRTAGSDIQTYGSLERVQLSRLDLSSTGGSGYGSDLDVSTVGGAITAVPVGFIYLIFAPFPWEMRNFRQSLTLPDVLLWWSMIPLIVYGLWYTLRNKLGAAFPILIFTLMLTISYSVFQGNLGAAYRQRTQIQVFLFIFLAVGWGLIRERMDDSRRMREDHRRVIERQLRARLQERQVQ